MTFALVVMNLVGLILNTINLRSNIGDLALIGLACNAIGMTGAFILAMKKGKREETT
jgi:hypothetical protein